jgi:hypothetical protein
VYTEVDMSKSRPMVVEARFIHHFLMECRDVEEARKAIPALTRAAFDGVRNGTMRVDGDSEAGLNIAAVNLDDPREK